MPATAAVPESLTPTEAWLVRSGLPYFVPRERDAAQEALRPRRTVPLLAGVGIAAVGLAVLLGMVFEDLSLGTAALTFVGIAAALAYAVTALRARPIVVWALQRTLGSLRQLLPTMTRALPGARRRACRRRAARGGDGGRLHRGRSRRARGRRPGRSAVSGSDRARGGALSGSGRFGERSTRC